MDTLMIVFLCMAVLTTAHVGWFMRTWLTGTDPTHVAIRVRRMLPQVVASVVTTAFVGVLLLVG